jgi:hypothetical protein
VDIDMIGWTKRFREASLARLALHFGAVMIVAAALSADAGLASPASTIGQGARALSAAPLLAVRGGVCDGGSDCPTEIEITPGPYRGRDDPIGHVIKRMEPSPLLAPEACPEEVSDAERLRADPSGCGIRCWYWRLRYGYCGPGCEYYRYRLGHRADFPDYSRPYHPPRSPHPHPANCRS